MTVTPAVRTFIVPFGLLLALSATGMAQAPAKAPAATAQPAVTTVPGMPPVADASNLYSEVTAGKMNPAEPLAAPGLYPRAILP